MNIQAVFFDIDGTLIDFKTHHISESTKEAIQKLQKKGIKAALATNRSMENLLLVKDIMSIDWDGFVLSSGGEVMNKNKEVLYERRFSPETIRKVYRIGRENHIPLYAFNKRKTLTFKNKDTEEFCDHFGLNPVEIISEWDGGIMDFITVIGHDQEKFYSLFKDDPNLRCVGNAGLNFDLFAAGTSKSNGIFHPMEYWGFPKNQFAALGNSLSDVDMLEEADLGLAMPWAEKSATDAVNVVMEDYGAHSIEKALQKERLI